MNQRDARRLAWALVADTIDRYASVGAPTWEDVPELSYDDWSKVESALDVIQERAHAAAGERGWALLDEATS